MAHVTENAVQETSATTGTGPITLSGATPGCARFSSVMSIGDTCHYLIVAVDAVGRPTGEREWGRGTYSAANTLTRTTVVGSTNGGSAVNFVSTSKLVSITVLAPTTTTLKTDWRGAMGLSNIDNTSDEEKPVSAAAQAELNAKAGKGVNSDITSLTGLTTALSVGQGGTGATTPVAARTNIGVAQVPVAQCYLTTSGSNLILLPDEGNWVFINGAYLQIPSEGITLSSAGAAASTLYCIYLTPSLTLERSTTFPVVDATYGVKVKSGDPTRLFVGLAHASSSSTWVNTASRSMVSSALNQKRRVAVATLANPVNVTSTALTQVGVDISWVNHDQPAVMSARVGFTNNSTVGNVAGGLGVDNPAALGACNFQTSLASLQTWFQDAHQPGGMSAGPHTVYLLARQSGGNTPMLLAGSAAFVEFLG